jgi:BirA family biotin operon repressor/biotin-[acetyl-CoA-carboxylase] ligase
MLNVARLEASLPIEGFGAPLYFYPSLDSTNDQAALLARQGAPHGTLVIADEQTAGKGRAGRRWFTPPGSAVAMSFVLHPSGLAADAFGGLVVLGSLAVAQALEDIGLEAEIKWPNDVLLEGRKVAGVLVENFWDGDASEHMILGIGVNVLLASQPPGDALEYPATCVEAVLGRAIDRHEFIRTIVRSVGHWYRYLNDKDIVEAWDERLAFRDQEVIITGESKEQRGVVQGITTRGELRLRIATGEVLNYPTGELRLRPVDSKPK